MQNDPQKKQELEQHEVKEVLRFLKQYGKLIGTGAVAAVVILLLSSWRTHRIAAREVEAEARLHAAQTSEQLREVVEQFKSTPAAVVALLDLAKNTFNDGDYAEARTLYENFLRQNRKHELRPTAELGVAYCLEAEGQVEKALEAFKSFSAKHAGHYLHPLAVLGQARVLKQSGRTTDARVVLENFLAASGDTVWAGLAENALLMIDR